LGFLNCFKALPFGNYLDFIVERALSIFTNHMLEIFELVASKKRFCSRKRMSSDARREREMSRCCM
jgi:hypothetical protein